jgi:uncharacterized protein
MADWRFYGRQDELEQVRKILARGRWFFANISGRRRIGKTTLIQRALEGRADRTFYVQIPDSAPSGVLSAFGDALETFGIPASTVAVPNTPLGFAHAIRALVQAGYVVALDEFQYFNRKVLFDFTSHLQAVVDELSRTADRVRGGLFVLGSVETEMAALLEDRRAPLFNRVTDHVLVDHFDIGSVIDILRAHADPNPERLLFLWNLFEGVPKFYRDCFEQSVLAADRATLLAQMFFRSSSPLRHEADNWFLHELRGRYDVVLKFIARTPGCTNGELDEHVRQASPESQEQTAGYVKILADRYRMIERRLPIFARQKERKGRYYIRDNFLRSWLAALAQPASAVNFRRVEDLVAQADERLRDAEGYGLERLVAQLYEERSRKGLGDFPLTERIDGYWDKAGTEIDLVAVNDEQRVIRFGSCKRTAEKVLRGLAGDEAHIARFLEALPKYKHYRVERAAIAPALTPAQADAAHARGWIPQDLTTLTQGL